MADDVYREKDIPHLLDLIDKLEQQHRRLRFHHGIEQAGLINSQNTDPDLPQTTTECLTKIRRLKFIINCIKEFGYCGREAKIYLGGRKK